MNIKWQMILLWSVLLETHTVFIPGIFCLVGLVLAIADMIETTKGK